MKNDITKEEVLWAKKQVECYSILHSRYEEYAEILKEVLNEITNRYAQGSLVQVRPKSIQSFAGKIWRKKNLVRDPCNEFTDLCGGRIISPNRNGVQAVCDFIEKNFIIDWENSVTIEQRLKPSEFGYRSVHYIVMFKKELLEDSEITISLPDWIFSLKAEIQVRTLLEHSWAEFSHQLVYKKSFEIPRFWQRELSVLAALLEESDSKVLQVQEGLKRYVASYGSYLTPKQIRREINILQNVLEYPPKDIETIIEIGRLATACGDWQLAIDTLEPFNHTSNRELLMLLGTAQCNLYEAEKSKSPEYRKGQEYLSKSLNLKKPDPATLCALAGTWRDIDDAEARKLYQQAFELDPKNPYPLYYYVDYLIADAKDLSFVPAIQPILQAAYNESRSLANSRLNLPWNYFNMGKFSLIMNKPYSAVHMYAKAILFSTTQWELILAERSHRLIYPVRDKIEGFFWIERLLILGIALKFLNKKERIARVKPFASKPENKIKAPVRIVAGGCSTESALKLEQYQNTVIHAFKDFSGTIISGGTKAGVSGMVGDIQKVYPNRITTIGYIPNLSDIDTDTRYKDFRQTTGNDYSVEECVQYWTDIIASGISPENVKLLGVGGGKIAGAEYRIALTFGALVGVIQGSGGEAGKILTDPDWKDDKNLIVLLNDPATIRAFIGSGIPAIDKKIIEKAAERIHINYLEVQNAQEPKKKEVSPSLKDWFDLPENLKESNRQQFLHNFIKIFSEDYLIRERKPDEIKIIKFSKAEVERMAEMEHGRWNFERVLDGWQYGTIKDVDKKINPSIVPWKELPEKVKNWDRNAIKKIPEVLAQIGYEIYPKSKKEKRKTKT